VIGAAQHKCSKSWCRCGQRVFYSSNSANVSGGQMQTAVTGVILPPCLPLSCLPVVCCCALVLCGCAAVRLLCSAVQCAGGDAHLSVLL
jgi:hypothetical protein